MNTDLGDRTVRTRVIRCQQHTNAVRQLHPTSRKSQQICRICERVLRERTHLPRNHRSTHPFVKPYHSYQPRTWRLRHNDVNARRGPLASLDALRLLSWANCYVNVRRLSGDEFCGTIMHNNLKTWNMQSKSNRAKHGHNNLQLGLAHRARLRCFTKTRCIRSLLLFFPGRLSLLPSVGR